MATRGRKPSVAHEDKIQILIKFNILQEDGTVVDDETRLKGACDEINKKYKPKPPMTVKNLAMFATRQKCCKPVENSKCDKVVQKTRVESKSKPSSTESVLLEMQNNVLYKELIREFVTYPFTLFHWSIEAIDFAVRLPDDVSFMFGLIGSFCNNVVAPDGYVSKKVHLHALGVGIEKEFLPICQISTEDASTSLFRRFFGECLKSKLTVPSTLTVEYYYNHLIPANSVFNINHQYEEYLTMCMKCLLGESDIQPRCLIFANVRLILLKFQNSQSFAKITLPGVKDFYLYGIILLSKQSDFHNFQAILKKIFIIAYSKYEYTLFTSCFDEIDKAIESHGLKETYNKEYLHNLKESYGYMLESETVPSLNYEICKDIVDVILAIFVEARSMIEKCAVSEETTEKHAYANEMFCKELMKLCIEFPIWTNIMSSVCSDLKKEENFENLLRNYKDQFLQWSNDDLNRSADEFLLGNIQYVENRLQNHRKNFANTGIKVKKIDDIERSLNALTENWMGKNSKEQHVQIDSDGDSSDSNCELDKCDISNNDEYELAEKSVNEIVKEFCEKLEQSTSMNNDFAGTLPDDNHALSEANGSLENLNKTTNVQATEVTPVRTKGKYLRADPEYDVLEESRLKYPSKRSVVQNIRYGSSVKISDTNHLFVTSAHFDSVLEVLVSTYFNFKSFQDYLNSLETAVVLQNVGEFLQIIREYSSTLSTTRLNKARAQLLIQIYVKDDDYGKWTWNQELGYLFAKLMPPNIFSKFVCSSCKMIMYEHHTFITMTLREASSQHHYSTMKDKLAIDRICNCKGKLVLDQIQIKSVLCYNVENTTVGTKECIGELSSFPIQLETENQLFTLTGVIAFEEGFAKGNPRHYVAYSRTLTDKSWVWFEYDNGNRTGNPRRVKGTLAVNVALLMYVEVRINNDDGANNDTSKTLPCNVIAQNFPALVHSPITGQSVNQQLSSSIIADESISMSELKASTPIEARKKPFDIEAFLAAANAEPFQEESQSDQSDAQAINRPENSWSWNDSGSIHPRKLIQNGSVIGEQEFLEDNNKPGRAEISFYKRRCATFRSTSSLDSCVEITVDLYLECEQFQFQVDDKYNMKKNKFFKVIEDYCSKFNLVEFYYSRASYLHPEVKGRVDEDNLKKNKLTYECSMNVINVFQSCMKGYPSFIEIQECASTYCTIEYSISNYFTSISVEQFHVKGIEHLQLYMNDTFSDREVIPCPECEVIFGKKTIETSWEFNEYFAINFEYLNQQENVVTTSVQDSNAGNDEFQLKIEFNRIPRYLYIRGKGFELKSIICFTGNPYEEINEVSQRHYFSYSLSNDNQWIKYDDMQDEILVLNGVPMEKIALIIYLKQIDTGDEAQN